MHEVIQFEPLNNSIIYHGISICHYQSVRQKTITTVPLWTEIVFGIAYLKEENVAYESIAAVKKELDVTLSNVVIFICRSKRKWSYMQ